MGRLIEQWKDINGYEGLYKISNYGRVQNQKGKILKPFKKGKYGHCLVGLSKNGISKKFQVHRLVALHFIPNPENKPEVCHIDNNFDENGLLNNSAINLMWGTHKENCEFENTRKRQSGKRPCIAGEKNPNFGRHCSEEHKQKMRLERGQKVIQMRNGEEIARYDSLKEAGRRTGIHWTNIRAVCKGEYKRAGGYQWEFAEKAV